MRVVEHRLETTASPDRVWSALLDVDHWPVWQDGLIKATLAGPPGPGRTGTLVLNPGGQRRFSIESLKPSQELVLEIRGWARRARLIHRLQPSELGCSLLFRAEIEGAGAWMDPWFRQVWLEQSLPRAARALACWCAVNPR